MSIISRVQFQVYSGVTIGIRYESIFQLYIWSNNYYYSKFKFRILLLVIKKNDDDQYFSDTKCRIPWEQYLKDWFSVKV